MSQLSIQLTLHSSYTTTRQSHSSAPVLLCAPRPSRGEECCHMHSPKQLAKLTMLVPLALLLLCNGVGNVHCSIINENSVDLQTLLDFKQGTNDPQGALSNRNTITHFYHWNGVNCITAKPFRVLTLNLTGQNLQGHITPSLRNLTSLILLDLSHNSFVGTFPVLNNNLQLKYLLMSHNNLTGMDPNALSNCSNLAYLDFSSNLLAGVIPPELSFLSYLYYIDFRSNQLEGSIPDELGKLQKLQGLYLGDNRLSGEFPRVILNLSSLQILSLEINMLGKALPANIGDLLPNLIEITLGGNTFEGHIPASLGNAPGLKVIDFSVNYFTGKIPTSFGKLANLTILNLELNQLEATYSRDWEFLNALTNCSSLNILSLPYNQLQGCILQSIGNLSPSLDHLLLYENNLSGQVPQSIGKHNALTKLALGGNSLSGTIEGWVGNLKSLRSLNLRSHRHNPIFYWQSY